MTITRDKAYGVPHIYGDTRADTMFGAGYAGAQDRLFLMDVLRHTGRAELASFLGGSNAGADASQWQFAPYTEADLEKQLREAPKLYGAKGQQAVEDLDSYVEGINAYIAAANLDPALKPAEYTLLSKPMEPWKPTDVVAIASLVGGIFGRGGGNELNSALTMQSFVERMGKEKGRAPPGSDSARRTTPKRRRRSPSRSPTRRDPPSPSAAWRCRKKAACTKKGGARASGGSRRRRTAT